MKRALAIFAKTPIPGLVKTRLTPSLSPEEAAELYRCMLMDTIARARTLQVDTLIFHQGDQLFFQEEAGGLPLIPQHAGGLGIRLETAFSTLSLLGYGPRVVIGSDAPDLPLFYIEEAFRLLEGGSEVVFGPAEDGGYYLVALGGAHGALFTDIPWSGPDVLARSLQRVCEAGLSSSLLPSWYDVDAIADLSRPGLRDPCNGAPLTRAFISERGIAPWPAAEAGSLLTG